MLSERQISQKNIYDYAQFLPVPKFRALFKQARAFKNKKIIHINATPVGGGPAEIFKSLIPLQQSLGLDSHWYYLRPDARLFNITKKLHNSLQGKKTKLSAKEKQYYQNYNQKVAQTILRIKPDIVIIHDPQPLAVIPFLKGLPAAARIHIDLTSPNPDSVEFLDSFLELYPVVVFSSEKFVPLNFHRYKIISPPAIDPLSKKNRYLSPAEVQSTCSKLGIDINRPFMLQVARFDPWKDPWGVLKAYRLVKNKIPDIQLVMAGVIEAQDDPEAKIIFKQIKRLAGKDKDIHLFSNIDQLRGVPLDRFINSLQSCADVVLLKSIKEGFGLVVSEAMWKHKAVIGGNAEGIRQQITDHKNGFIVLSPKEAAEKVILLLRNESLREKMGRFAHQTVKQKFLITRLLFDEFKIMRRLLSLTKKP